ncbi:Cytochrome c oxidase assembly protein cox15 [Apophysomyces sp. BC1015]|nr:Cytochrome c oxidase assembly protein cox15 [Apophysomyces sp. BC1015]
MQPPTDHPSYHYRPSAFSDARSAYQPTLPHSQGEDYTSASTTTAVAAAGWTSSPGIPWNSSSPPLPPSASSSFMTGARPGYGASTTFGPTSSSIPGLPNAIQRPKLTTTVWEDEGTLCYQVDAKSVCVARRQDNDMINGTKLLNVVGMSRGKRDGILKNEKGRVVVKVGAMHLKGVWITFSRAKDLATKFKIVDLLYPLFVEDPSVFLCHTSPVNSTSTSTSNSSANGSMPMMMPTIASARTMSHFHYRPTTVDHCSMDMQGWDRSYPTSLPSITSTQQEQWIYGVALMQEPGAVPRVSQYRLTAHLATAFAIYGSSIFVAADILRQHKLATGTYPKSTAAMINNPVLKRFRIASHSLAGLVFLTAMSGGLVAGLDAGLIYNEFPFMGEGIIPPTSELWSDEYVKPTDNGRWRNLLENPTTVQFDHRTLAETTATLSTALWLYSRRLPLPKNVKMAVNTMMGAVVVQVTLGISTLIYMVPIELGAAHQAGALALLTSNFWLIHALRRVPL